MKSHLIILRGNSGSGKSTVARCLQRELGYGTMLVAQDVVRREILRVHETPDNPSDTLMEMMARYGRSLGYNVIVEGILRSPKHTPWLHRLVNEWEGPVYTYYFDIPFEETLRRHATKPNAHEFGESEMREWWVEHDFLGVPGEQTITKDESTDSIIARILRDIAK